jgi:hypothetical protein
LLIKRCGFGGGAESTESPTGQCGLTKASSGAAERGCLKSALAAWLCCARGGLLCLLCRSRALCFTLHSIEQLTLGEADAVVDGSLFERSQCSIIDSLATHLTGTLNRLLQLI